LYNIYGYDASFRHYDLGPYHNDSCNSKSQPNPHQLYDNFSRNRNCHYKCYGNGDCNSNCNCHDGCHCHVGELREVRLSIFVEWFLHLFKADEGNMFGGALMLTKGRDLLMKGKQFCED
jgi:hypothetical protein